MHQEGNFEGFQEFSVHTLYLSWVKHKYCNFNKHALHQNRKGFYSSPGQKHINKSHLQGLTGIWSIPMTKQFLCQVLDFWLSKLPSWPEFCFGTKSVNYSIPWLLLSVPQRGGTVLQFHNTTLEQNLKLLRIKLQYHDNILQGDILLLHLACMSDFCSN